MSNLATLYYYIVNLTDKKIKKIIIDQKKVKKLERFKVYN